MRKILSLALAAISFLPAPAQNQFEASAQDLFEEPAQDQFRPDNRIEAYVSGSLVSQYMWRGIDMAGPSLQPEVNIAWRGLSLDIASSIPFDKEDIKDIDVTLSYTLAGFNIGVIDYWTSGVDPRERYFYYSDKADCPHQLEANIGYSCKYFSLQAYTMVYGNDYKIDGKRAYSTFIELGVPFRLGGLDWDLRAGITPMESAGTTYQEQVITETGKTKTYTRGDWVYGESFTCNMASLRATKQLEFKHFQMPIFVELHTNPYLQRANLVLGISFNSL